MGTEGFPSLFLGRTSWPPMPSPRSPTGAVETPTSISPLATWSEEANYCVKPHWWVAEHTHGHTHAHAHTECNVCPLQGYKMDDLLTSYISQMLTSMNKQHSGWGQSKWTSYWQETGELIRLLRHIGHPCSWGWTFAHQLWRMNHSPSASSDRSHFSVESSTVSRDDPCEGSSNCYQCPLHLDRDEPSSEDDYLWDLYVLSL